MKCLIDADALKCLVNNTKKFLNKDGYGNSKMMQYIYLEIDAEAMLAKATAVNGYSISVEYAKCLECDQSFTCYIKPNIPKITKRDRLAELELIDNKLYVTVGENIVGFVQPKDSFYKVDDLVNKTLEKEPRASIYVDKNLLLAAVQSLDSLDYKKPVRIEIREKNEPVVIRTDINNIRFVLSKNVSDVERWEGSSANNNK